MVKKQFWNTTDDNILKTSIINYTLNNIGKLNWKQISEKCQEQDLHRTPSQCQQRWSNHLDPSLIKDRMSKCDLLKLLDYYRLFGSKWSFISLKFNRKSGAVIKNTFFNLVKNLFSKLNYLRNNYTDEFMFRKIPSNFYKQFLLEEISDDKAQCFKQIRVLEILKFFIKDNQNGVSDIFKGHLEVGLECLFARFRQSYQEYTSKNFVTRKSKREIVDHKLTSDEPADNKTDFFKLVEVGNTAVIYDQLGFKESAKIKDCLSEQSPTSFVSSKEEHNNEMVVEEGGSARTTSAVLQIR